MSHDSNGDNYACSAQYLADMSQPFKYGDYCELVASSISLSARLRFTHFKVIASSSHQKKLLTNVVPYTPTLKERGNLRMQQRNMRRIILRCTEQS